MVCFLSCRNGYVCICSAGYSGNNCQTDINECGSDPCANGGACTDLVDVVSLICQFARRLSLLIRLRALCVCVSNRNGYTCTCLPGYSGLRCQTDINECASNPCINGATCVDHSDGWSCRCVPGYSGTICQTDINECASNPCVNGAICQDQINRFICLCQPGYNGPQCQTDINECASTPCGSTGGCTDLVYVTL